MNTRHRKLCTNILRAFVPAMRFAKSYVAEMTPDSHEMWTATAFLLSAQMLWDTRVALQKIDRGEM